VDTSEIDLALMKLIDRQYLATPFYGSRKIAAWLKNQGHIVNRKKACRLMQVVGLKAIYRKPRTSKLFVEGVEDHPSQSSLGGGYHLHPDAARVLVPGSNYGLVQPLYTFLAIVQYSGG
jgi:hypothetical protein